MKNERIRQGIMKKKVFYVCFFVCLLFIVGTVNAEEQIAGMPNPAVAYAAKLGYKYEIREGEAAVVIFPDGTECKGWDFFRGKAGQKWTYCEQQGGKIENRIENMGTWTAEYAVCVFPDGTERKEADHIEDNSVRP